MEEGEVLWLLRKQENEKGKRVNRGENDGFSFSSSRFPLSGYVH